MQNFILRFHRVAIAFDCASCDRAQLHEMKLYNPLNASFKKFHSFKNSVYNNIHPDETPFLSFFAITLSGHHKY